MIAGGRGGTMPCESCGVQFSVFKRKRVCCECERFYCSACLRRGGGAMCAPCRVMSTRPLYRNTIAHLKVRDLQCFLQRQNVSTRGCVEKEELVNLCVSHVNGAAYRRRGARSAAGAFSSLKGLTNNINDFINNAFDLRPPAPAPAPAPARAPPRTEQEQQRNCFNSSHAHRGGGAPPPPPQRELFSPTPGGEPYIEVGAYEPRAASRSPSAGSARVDTADCFEVEDLDDAGWEFVARPPAVPLPNDSDVLLSTTDGAALRQEHAGAPPDICPTGPSQPGTCPYTGPSQPGTWPSSGPSQPDLRPSNGPSQPDTRSSTGQSQPARHSAGSSPSAPPDERIPQTLPRPTISREYSNPGNSDAQ